MTSAATEMARGYDPFSQPVMRDPHPFYKILRQENPVCYIEKYDTFFFSRFQDVMDLMSLHGDVLVSSESTLPTPDFLLGKRNTGAPPRLSTAAPLPQGGMLGSPYYDELRAAHIKPLRPKSVKSKIDLMREIANDRLDLLLPHGRFDLVQEYSGILSAGIVCHLFDIPTSRARIVLDKVNAATVTDPEKGGFDYGKMVADLMEEILPAVQRRRAAGADGEVPLIDGMLNYRIDGRPLDDAEVAEQLFGVFIGGTETVPKIAAHGLMELANNPLQLAAVRQDLDANVPVAVEEIIRYCAPAQWFMRTAHQDVVIAGQLVRAGQRVVALFGSAARDEREFDDPDSFRWDRKISRVLSFGFGQHHCVGLHVARAELRVLLQEFLRRVPVYRIDAEAAIRNPSSFQWGWNSIPVIVG